jgi:membrane dipeptidase
MEWNPGGIGLAGFGMGIGYQQPAPPRYAFPMRYALIFSAAAVLHAQAIGIDTHIDTAQRVLIDRTDITQRSPVGHVDIPRLKEGGVNAPFFALWVPAYYKGPEAIRRTLDLRDAMQRVFDTHPELIAAALTAADIERITRSGRIAAILTLEGGHQIDNDLAVLRMYHRLGIRAMTLTHFRNNEWADSSTDKSAHNGLTAFGKDVVKEMNRIGMIVDVSHVSDKTFYDALAASTKPVIATHSSCRELSNVPRNMTDDMLRALAKNGGVVGINFGEGFLNPKDAEKLMATVESLAADPALTGKALDDYAAEELHRDLKPVPSFATIEDAVSHIDHAITVAGIDHVGIGSDFDGISSPPKGLEDISKMPALKVALKRHGYSDEDLKKVFGGNVLRVMREVIGK